MKNKKLKITIVLIALIPTVVWAANLTDTYENIQFNSETQDEILYNNSFLDHSEQNNVISVKGIVESGTTRNVYGQLPNTINNVFVEVGDKVTVGQILAVQDTRDIELSIAQQRAALSQSLKNGEANLQERQRVLQEAYENLDNITNTNVLKAESALEAAEINLNLARKNYDIAMADYLTDSNADIFQARTAMRDIEVSLENLQIEHNNLETLYNVGAVSREDLNQSQIAITNLQNMYNDATIAYQNVVTSNERTLSQLELSLEQAQVEYDLAKDMLDTMNILDEQERTHLQQQINGLQAGVEMAGLGLDFTAAEIGIEMLEKQLADAQVRSPINGVITDAIAKEGINGAGLLFVVQDLDNLEIKTRVREYDIKDIYVGMEVSIRSYTSDNVYRGRIKSLYPTAIPSIPVEFDVVVEVIDVDTDLLVGSSAWVDIVVES